MCYTVAMNIRLESINPDANRYRYYLVSLSPTLWGNWGVACRWGRIGESYRGERLRECAGQDEERVRRDRGGLTKRVSWV